MGHDFTISQESAHASQSRIRRSRSYEPEKRMRMSSSRQSSAGVGNIQGAILIRASNRKAKIRWGVLGTRLRECLCLGWHLTPQCACPKCPRSGFQHGSIARIALADKVERLVGVGELETLDLRAELVARGELQHLVD
jgi:hypothetical protein